MEVYFCVKYIPVPDTYVILVQAWFKTPAETKSYRFFLVQLWFKNSVETKS